MRIMKHKRHITFVRTSPTPVLATIPKLGTFEIFDMVFLGKFLKFKKSKKLCPVFYFLKNECSFKQEERSFLKVHCLKPIPKFFDEI